MDKMKDLKALLQHDVQMLLSAEEQLIEAMPAMIKKAQHPSVKQALEQHLRITEKQLDRIKQVVEKIGADENSVKDYTSLMSNITDGGVKCKGMEGLIKEGQKIMAEKLSPEVMDAAIVAGSQKIEHYEIACYGTARTYAHELGLHDVAELLQQTLDEEYEADRKLTDIAESHVNERAEMNGR